jgi:hypothetical protein
MRTDFDQPALLEVEAGDSVDHEEYGGPGELFGTADYSDLGTARDRKSTRLNSSHNPASRMPSSA